MAKNALLQKQMNQVTMFGTNEFPSYEEILEAYVKEFTNYVHPKGGHHIWLLDANSC